jgi:cytochrome c5
MMKVLAKTVIRSLCVLSLVFAAINSYAAEQKVYDRYNKTCILCHASGVAGAPQFGDVDQWAPRLKKGMDVLVTNVDQGFGQMTAKGMCFDCSADDFKALIELMATGK